MRAVLVASLLLVAAATPACGRVPGQFVILNDQVPLDGCIIPTDTTIYRGSGRVDVGIVRQGARSAYLVYPLLKNNLPASTGGIDSGQITLTGFNVDISALSGAQPLTAQVLDDPANRGLVHYQVPWSGTVSSGGGLISASVNALPVDLAMKIQGTQEINLSPSLTLNLRVTGLGHTPNQDMESDPIDFPITVCAGCLIANLQSCPYMTAMLAHPGNPCNPAQDNIVDCCLSGADLLCPGPAVPK